MFISRHVVFDEFNFPFKKQLSGSIFTSTASPDWSTWLPVLAPQPSAATCAPQLASYPVSATEDQVLPTHLTLPPSGPVIPYPISSSTLLRFSGASLIVADLPHPTSQPILPTPASGPSCVGSDSAPLLTYSRRSKANRPSMHLSAVAVDLSPQAHQRRATFQAFKPDPNTNREVHSSSSLLSQSTSKHPMITRSRQILHSTSHVALLAESYLHTEPKTYNQAKSHSHWVEAMTMEHNALLANNTWDLVPPSSTHNIVGCK